MPNIKEYLKTKKLAFCVLRYFPYGGVQRDMMGVISLAVSQGYWVDIYCIHWEGDKPSHHQINIIELPVLGWSNHAKAKNFTKKLKKIFNQKYYYRKISFNRLPYTDVCFIGDHCFLQHLKNKNSKLAGYLPRYKIYADLERGVFESNSQVVLINPEEKKIYQNYFPDKKQNIHLIAPWVQEKILSKQEAESIRIEYREKFNLNEDGFLILFMASQFYAKGLDRALLAVSHLPEDIKCKTKILIAGDGKKKFCLEKIKEYSIEHQAVYLGPRDDAQCLMLSADVFIHPARVELAGKVLLEAIINNLPTLTTQACGCAAYISEAKSGEVVTGGYTQEKLDQKLLSMLDKNQLNIYINNANNYQKKTSFNKFPEQVLKIIENYPAQGADGLYINDELCEVLPVNKKDLLKSIFELSGKTYRHVKARKTMQVEINHKAYFVKLHNGVGWKEIIKNLLYLRLPVISAKQEVRAVRALEKLNIKTLNIAAYAEAGINPARIKSFLLTNTINYQLTLEDLAIEWQKQKPDFAFKRLLIKRVAEIARAIHQNRIAHRDFYICHFLLSKNNDKNFDLTLIDLHRTLIHKKKMPVRWLVKDLAALYFSAMDAGLSHKDYCYFLKHYHQCSLRSFNRFYAQLWASVAIKAGKLYQRNSLA